MQQWLSLPHAIAMFPISQIRWVLGVRLDAAQPMAKEDGSRDEAMPLGSRARQARVQGQLHSSLPAQWEQEGHRVRSYKGT